MAITRRDFLLRVGQAGGFSAAFTVMQTLGLMPIPEAEAVTWNPSPEVGKGTKVVILGGGIAGMVSAYEMGKLGYQCTILEARTRPGGRNWTVRNGTTIEFTDGTKQTAAWEPDSYFNAGPARLPSTHRTMLGYCKELGVPLEVEVNTSRSALLVKDDAFGGKPIQQREAINDTRGHVSELLAKCVQQNALNQEMTADDRERMLAFLRAYGDLGGDYTYKGSERAGVLQLPGAGNVTESLRPPLDMHALLDAEFWRGMLFEEMFDMQATMMQPVGGMDRIPYAFAEKLRDVINFQCQVTEIRRTAKGVRVSYMQKGAPTVIEGDYCICALPISILKSIPNDFSPRIQQAIAETEYDDAFKVAWESPRFWETDFNIYGGISYVFSGPVNLLWYPSAKLFSETGVVVSGYGVERMSDLAKLPNIQKKTDASRAAVEKLHPGYGKLLSNPMYMNWGRIPFNLGSWVSRPYGITGSAQAGYYEGPYKQFIEPDGPFIFAGDHCSHIVAWQEGAALSAQRALKLLGERVSASKS
jgi:monoamine oxidase